MKNILVFAGSNSSISINKKLAVFASKQLSNVNITVLDLNDFEMPIYSYDREAANGIPAEAKKFADLLKESDGVIVSFPEHNTNFTAAFKNILEWVSRLKLKSWSEKVMLIMSASPNEHGGISVLKIAEPLFTRFGANVIGAFRLANFESSFSDSSGIADMELKQELNGIIQLFSSAIEG